MCTQRVDLDTFPLLNEHQQEIPVYSFEGKHIHCQEPSEDAPEPQCGILIDLKNIQALFNPGDQLHIANDDNFLNSDLPESPFINVYAYPLGFLRVAGNIQATAPRAGRMDSQQGSVTAVLSGTFAQTPKDKRAASRKRAYCDQALPSTRFHKRISRPECPKCCRAEFVYSVDVRSLKSLGPSGKLIFDKIILPLAKSWKRRDVRNVIKDFLVVFKPNDLTPCPMRLEFLAALERLLCYCHTGNTAVLATSLMHPLGLSKGVLKDGFPMLLQLFFQPSVQWAVKFGFQVDPRRWPLQAKNGHPAIASKRAQILTYSMNHFLCFLSTVIILHPLRPYMVLFLLWVSVVLHRHHHRA
ncbi:hypothetical protein EDB89DRAFT_1915798 [Lactarius sanguifluus]|nr:hypothetical protein EDB89DRAFT_1915798 [Lactarius sanguifluus]